jgi:hypothetical protein
MQDRSSPAARILDLCPNQSHSGGAGEVGAQQWSEANIVKQHLDTTQAATTCGVNLGNVDLHAGQAL